MQPSIFAIIADLADFCAARGIPAWLVGGAPRDLLLGRSFNDLDLAVAGDGLALARAYANARAAAFVALDTERSVGRVVIPANDESAPLTIDIARLRGPTIEQDLALRDFTINGLALPLGDSARWRPMPPDFSACLIDPLGGAADLVAGRLRACGATSMSDDPLRSLRAARLAALFNLAIDPQLDAAIRRAAPAIVQVAAERIRDELLKLLEQPVAALWLRYLDQVRLLTRIVPELEPARDCTQPHVHFLPVLAHSLETVAVLDWLLDEEAAAGGQCSRPAALQAYPELSRQLPYAERLAAGFAERRGGGVRRGALLKLAALLHDNAKPQTRTSHADGSVSFYGHQEQGAEVAGQVCRRLRLGRADGGYVAMVVREHMRPGQLRGAERLTRRAVVRFFRDTNGAGADVLIHELADHMATRGPVIEPAAWQAHLEWIRLMLAVYFEAAPISPAPLVRGDELMHELGLAPGPLVGMLLREIAEARASGEISERSEALALAHRLLAQHDQPH